MRGFAGKGFSFLVHQEFSSLATGFFLRDFVHHCKFFLIQDIDRVQFQDFTPFTLKYGILVTALLPGCKKTGHVNNDTKLNNPIIARYTI